MNIILIGKVIFVLFMIWVTYVFIRFYKRDEVWVSTERRSISINDDIISIDNIEYVRAVKSNHQPNPFEYLIVSYLFSARAKLVYICDFEIHCIDKTVKTARIIHQRKVYEELTKLKQLTNVKNAEYILREASQYNIKPYVIVLLTVFLITMLAILTIQNH